ncbi:MULTISPECIES: MBL fold metallo-hydrolase [unclassified Carboxylicivirga]|uniref:MBL fold metallo-hydrolase n=1 Tax=Carboxylicivirga TaxID=1628153 RepID=UPI003D32EEB4
MKLRTLIDNKQSKKQLKCEHGLSFLLETDEHIILFDVGQSDKFISNAQKMGVDLTKVDTVVLSHGHYDHTGGLPHFLRINKKARVLIHRSAFKERFSRSEVMIKENGIPWRKEMDTFKDRLQLINEDTQLAPGIRLLTNIEAVDGHEVSNQRLVVKKDSDYVPDDFEDEIILVAQQSDETIVLCGCAHNGIVNILSTVSKRLNCHKFRCVAGGLHLKGQNTDSIKHVLQGITDFKVEQWALNHCTGDKAFELFENTQSGTVTYCGSGYSLKL